MPLTDPLQLHIEQSTPDDCWSINANANYALHYVAEAQTTAVIDLTKRRVVGGTRGLAVFVPGTSLMYACNEDSKDSTRFKDAETGAEYSCPLRGGFTAVRGGIAQISRNKLLFEKPTGAGWVGGKLDLPQNAIKSRSLLPDGTYALRLCGNIETPTLLDWKQGLIWVWKDDNWTEIRKNFTNDTVRADSHGLVTLNHVLSNATLCRQWDYSALESPLGLEKIFPKFRGKEVRTVLTATKVIQQVEDNGECKVRIIDPCVGADIRHMSTVETYSKSKAFLVGSYKQVYQLDAQGLKLLNSPKVVMPDFEF